MNTVLKLPILLITSILGAPLWMIVRTWYGFSFFIWMMLSYGILVLLHYWLVQIIVTDVKSQWAVYLLVEYTYFFREYWPLFIGYQISAFLLQQVGIALFKFPKPAAWSMGSMALGQKTPAGFMLFFLFGILAFFSLRYTFLLNITAGQAVIHGLTVYALGLLPLILFLFIERANNGLFPLGIAKSLRNRSRICNHSTKYKETLSDIFSRRSIELKLISEAK